MSLYIVPCTLKQANRFVAMHHRHNGPVTMARFSLACADNSGVIHGVAIVGTPEGYNSADGWTIEVKRVATDGTHNACSILYAASWNAAKAMGYRKAITYTLPTESQSSLKAVGWTCIPDCGGVPWSTNKQRKNREVKPIYLVKKNRWEVTVSSELPFPSVTFPEQETPQLTMFEGEEAI